MRRGDIVTVSAPGDYGKPRPAVIVQSDALAGTNSVLVCLMTSTLQASPLYRLTVHASPENGLKRTSQIMVDKIIVFNRIKCGPVMGRLERAAIIGLNAMLVVVLGVGE